MNVIRKYEIKKTSQFLNQVKELKLKLYTKESKINNFVSNIEELKTKFKSKFEFQKKKHSIQKDQLQQ